MKIEDETLRDLRSVWGLEIYFYCNNTFEWRHNELDGVSNHQAHDCLRNRLSRRRSEKTSKLRVTGLCAENLPVTGVNSTHRGPVTRKMFPFDDVIMKNNHLTNIVATNLCVVKFDLIYSLCLVFEVYWDHPYCIMINIIFYLNIFDMM